MLSKARRRWSLNRYFVAVSVIGMLALGIALVLTMSNIMQTQALLKDNPNPTEEEIRFYLAGNLCRCTGYDKIVKAVQQTAMTQPSCQPGCCGQ